MCLWEPHSCSGQPHSVLLESSRSSDLGVNPRIDLTELGACRERWVPLGSGDAGNNPRCGRGWPLTQEAGGAQASLASGGAKWSTFWRPHLSLCAFRVQSSGSFRNRIRAGCVVVGRKLALCPRSCFCSLAPTDGPVQEPLGSGWGLLPGPEHICPQHLSVSQALTVTAGQPGGFAPSHSSRMLSVNGTRLFSGRSWSWHCVFVKRV